MGRVANHAAAALVVLAFHVGPAAAIDGEILLTQQKALAGDPAHGDAPGFPIALLLPGTYKFASNIDVPPGVGGIGVRVDNVTIDLAGFRLSGGGKAKRGISGKGRSNITIRNGTIEGFNYAGIYATAESIDTWTIENMRIRANARGVFVLPITNMANTDQAELPWTITDSQIVDNKLEGVYLGPEHVVVRGSVITGNGASGIAASSGDIQGSIIADNGDIGISLGSGTVLGNTILDNQSFGLRSGAGARRVGYGNNTFSGNNEGGAQVSGGVQLHPNVCRDAPC